MLFTGERYVPTEQVRIRLEHFHRYGTIRKIVTDKDVLDIACGEGYGSSLISSVARSIVGVDISDAAIHHASSTYSASNLKFRQGSATQIPEADASFDVIVSFETIEHLAEQEQMLAEIRRVLRPNGCLVISSPNRPVYSEESGEANHFHVKELDFKEFDNLLRAQFLCIEYYGQRISMGSVIQPLSGSLEVFKAWHDDGVALQLGTGTLTDPMYFVAVCGSNASSISSLGASFCNPTKLDLVKHYVGFAKWAQVLDKTVNERDGQIASLKQNLTERDGQIASLKRSYSWRLTAPLREARRWATSPMQQVKRYTKGTLRLTKRIYQSLPLSFQTKAKHRLLIAKFSPRLLLATGSHSVTIPASSIPPLAVNYAPVNPENLIIHSSDRPLVSVIIPIYGKIEYTLSCLASIAANPPQAAFEVIVVDDCSLDDSFDVLSKVKGIRLLRNEQNQGFIRSSNLGAKAAKGEYLYFLNNDTQVTLGWLNELLRTFSEFPGTGLTGSKLIYPDGRLQEAGGGIWQDGSAWNFGRFQDPLLPVYNYAREVDYCSGASIMVPKSLFTELGGFDEHYLPAYCEDSDLALKIRDKGYRVIYQPLSTVIHYEGITSGTDTTQGPKSYQIDNSKKLFVRWQKRLKSHQVAGVDVDNAKDRMAKRRVLVLDHCTPTPNKDAGSVTVFNILLLLREMDFQVTFIPEDNFLYIPEYTPTLQRVGVEVLYSPYSTSVEHHLREFGDRYDLVFMFRPIVVERNIIEVRKFCKKAKVLFHTVDLHYLRMQREAELQNDKTKMKHALEMMEREILAIRSVDSTIVHSTAERELLRSELHTEKITVFPLIMNVPGTNIQFSDRRDIVFVGGYQHTPNIDAVQYFVSEIMPLLRKQLPGIRFNIVGSKPPPEIIKLASEDVIVRGFIEDLPNLLDQMRISVAPLRYGAGIKGKIGTAMAVGLPVIATPLAVEGMCLTDGENIIVADGVEAFVSSIVKLYESESLWNNLSQKGLIFADQAWGAEAAWEILANILFNIGIPSQRGSNQLVLYNAKEIISNSKNKLSEITNKETKQESSSQGYLKKI
jgi:GT2 family glycosyltransferase/SAM-dependent methyltransferase/glycosyltransferase involved in cell wall biosynthesis